MHPSMVRLYAAVKSRDVLTQTQLANLLNTSPQAVHNWEKRGLSRNGALQVQGQLGISSTWLLEGRGPQEAGEADERDWSDVPGYAQAVGLGSGPEADEYAEAHKLKFRADSLSRKRLYPRNLAVMYGSGDSMLPRIHPGDAILFDQSDTTPRDGRIYVVMVPGAAGSEYQAKRCMVLDDAVYFTADNPTGDHTWRRPKRMDDKKHPIRVLGRVRWIGSWEG